jgi:TDG/mug DNA glycosylase family protein
VILPDYLAPGLRVVFCGTAAGAMSAKRGHYYANPGNRFWHLLAETGLTPHRLRPEEDATATTHGIGLTDLAKHVAGQDADLPYGAFDVARMVAAVAAVAPRALAFTSLTAARVLAGPAARPGPLPGDPRLPGVALWALPSPSGLARSHFSPAPWAALAASLR